MPNILGILNETVNLNIHKIYNNQILEYIMLNNIDKDVLKLVMLDEIKFCGSFIEKLYLKNLHLIKNDDLRKEFFFKLKHFHYSSIFEASCIHSNQSLIFNFNHTLTHSSIYDGKSNIFISNRDINNNLYDQYLNRNGFLIVSEKNKNFNYSFSNIIKNNNFLFNNSYFFDEFKKIQINSMNFSNTKLSKKF